MDIKDNGYITKVKKNGLIKKVRVHLPFYLKVNPANWKN